METLNPAELSRIDGGWDWHDYADGVAVGLGAGAAVLATGGAALGVEAVILAWSGVAVAAADLFL